MKIIYFATSVGVGITLIFQSCIFSDCLKIPLKSNDLEWFENLTNLGDTIFFKGSDSSVDTFLISNKYKEYGDCNRFEKGKFQYQEFRFKGIMLNKKVRDSFINNFDIRFTKELQSDSTIDCYKSMQVFDLYFEGLTSLKTFKCDTIFIESQHKKIPTVFVEESSNTKKESSSWVKIKNFHWSKKYGLLRYTTEDGVIYEYWKKS